MTEVKEREHLPHLRELVELLVSIDLAANRTLLSSIPLIVEQLMVIIGTHTIIDQDEEQPPNLNPNPEGQLLHYLSRHYKITLGTKVAWLAEVLKDDQTAESVTTKKSIQTAINNIMTGNQKFYDEAERLSGFDSAKGIASVAIIQLVRKLSEAVEE